MRIQPPGKIEAAVDAIKMQRLVVFDFFAGNDEDKNENMYHSRFSGPGYVVRKGFLCRHIAQGLSVSFPIVTHSDI